MTTATISKKAITVLGKLAKGEAVKTVPTELTEMKLVMKDGQISAAGRRAYSAASQSDDKKEAKVKAPKEPKAPKTKKADKVETPKERADRAAADKCGISYVKYRILLALSKADDALSYSELEEKTSYRHRLPGLLRRQTKEGEQYSKSLGTAGLVKEILRQDDKKNTLCFALTTAGKKLLAKA